jgi:hypothetical protein
MILMAGKTSGDSSRRVPGIIFPVIQDSFTTQGLARHKPPSGTDSSATAGPIGADAVGRFTRFFESRLNIA